MRNVRFYQTEDMKQTVAVKIDKGHITIGIARAGKHDIENGNITVEGGMTVALGRLIKAEKNGNCLCEKNYLRGIKAKIVPEGAKRLRNK